MHMCVRKSSRAIMAVFTINLLTTSVYLVARGCVHTNSMAEPEVSEDVGNTAVTPRVKIAAIEEVIDDGTNGLQAKAIHVVASAALRIPEGAVFTALFD